MKGKVVGAMTAPGPVLLNDFKKVTDAILFNIMPGQEYAKGLMNVLFGRVNPSAKLSFTMPNIDNEQKMSEAQYQVLTITGTQPTLRSIISDIDGTIKTRSNQAPSSDLDFRIPSLSTMASR